MPNEVPNNTVLEVKLDFIQKDIAVLKTDIKEIKSGFVKRREFNEQMPALSAQAVVRPRLLTMLTF